MDVTPGWELPLLFAGQAHKDLFHNEALVRIDTLLHPVVESADLNVPPSAPSIGVCWIVAAGGTGEWAGRDDAIACWTEGGWRFVAPRHGLTALVADRGHAMWYDGTGWQDAAVRADGIHVAGDRVVAGRQGSISGPTGGSIVDVEAREAVDRILSALRAHGLIST